MRYGKTRKVLIKPSPHALIRSRGKSKKIRQVSQYAEFGYNEVLCFHCNTKSEIHRKPMRCPIHSGGRVV